ncbi:MAG: hypothetical protein JXA60_08010 [Candidatus Coatesbacteria bacterium]|nr:hypothetical protein [Candidatus Coatesbacteria bacterium]
MKISVVKIEVLDDCFKDTTLFDFIFSKALQDDFINSLSSLGEFEYYTEFPKPFYKVFRNGSFMLKGIKNSPNMRVSLFPENKVESLNELIAFFHIDNSLMPILKKE